MADLDEYERDYLERLKKQEKENPKSKKQSIQWEEDPLTPFDYVLMGLMRNGVSKLQTMFGRLGRVSTMKITKRINEIEKRGLLEWDKKEGWLTRQWNPKITLTDKGKEEIEKKIDELQEDYDKLVLLYEKKDKQKLREGMESNRSFFPLMMMMGITNGMMMGSMLGMNHMMMADFMADVDYANDLGYGDGAGFGGEGGDFGDTGGDGDGGGFMDGGMNVGF